jgi:hypothetical protein
VPPGDILGRLGANDGRWNYWYAQVRRAGVVRPGGVGGAVGLWAGGERGAGHTGCCSDGPT